MRSLIFLTLYLIFAYLGTDVCAQAREDIFTIYLVRHSEKDLDFNNYSDPPLAQCGQQRAEHLSSFLEDVNLKAIYSTDYIRTKTTAMPTVTSKNLKINNYNPKKLKEFSEFLKNRKENALVVGHSNTTAVLAGLLVDKTLEEFDSGIYDRIYQVVICNDKGRLHLLHMPLDCQD